MKLSEIVKIVEDIVSIPSYFVAGIVGNRLVYISDESGFLGIWSTNLLGEDKVLLTKRAIHSIAKTRYNCDFVVYTRDVSGGFELQKIYSINVRGGEEVEVAEMNPLRVIGLAYDGKEIVFTGATKQNVSVYRIKNGVVEKIVDLPGMAFITDFRNGIAVGSGSLRGDPRSMELFLVDVRNGLLEIFSPKEGSVNKAPAFLNNREIFFETNAFNGSKLYKFDIVDKKFEKLVFENKDYELSKVVEHSFWKSTKDGVLVVGKEKGRSKLFLDGKLVETPRGMITGADAYGGKIFFSHNSLLTPPAIYISEQNGYRRILGGKLPESVKGFGDAKFVEIDSEDGLKVPTFVIESKRSGKPGPVVVYVHGGPWSEVADMWSVLIASLVATGFHVIAPNFRGSTGYGEDFRLMDIGDPGGGDFKDVLSAARWARNLKLASKVAIMGYSYGGYMTLWAVGKAPNEWDCAVAGAAVADWIEMRELSDAIFRSFIDILFAGDRDLMAERSPINYVENVSAPLCIIHPQNDSRTPLKPVLKYINKMLELGKKFEAHIVPDMGHIIQTIEDAEKILLPAIIFLRRCMKD